MLSPATELKYLLTCGRGKGRKPQQHQDGKGDFSGKLRDGLIFLHTLVTSSRSSAHRYRNILIQISLLIEFAFSPPIPMYIESQNKNKK